MVESVGGRHDFLDHNLVILHNWFLLNHAETSHNHGVARTTKRRKSLVYSNSAYVADHHLSEPIWTGTSSRDLYSNTSSAVGYEVHQDAEDGSRDHAEDLGSLLILPIGAFLGLIHLVVKVNGYFIQVKLMGIPDGDRNEILTTLLVTENGDSYLLSWLEPAKHNVANIFPLLVGSPAHGFDNQMSECDIRPATIV